VGRYGLEKVPPGKQPAQGQHDAAPLAALGVSVRSLQEGFRQWWNTARNGFLRQTRLCPVREELLRSDESTDVTSVALRHGFAHLGRFSGYCHAAFGELPRVTLRRRRILTPRPEAADVRMRPISAIRPH
jgi:AraC-like DNA-binding protein